LRRRRRRQRRETVPGEPGARLERVVLARRSMDCLLFHSKRIGRSLSRAHRWIRTRTPDRRSSLRRSRDALTGWASARVRLDTERAYRHLDARSSDARGYATDTERRWQLPPGVVA